MASSASITSYASHALLAAPSGQLNWYQHVQGKMALPKVLESIKRLVGEHKILRSASGNLELSFERFATQPQARLVLPWDFPSSAAVLFIHSVPNPRPIVLSSFNSDHEINVFAQSVALARAQHAYTAATTSAIAPPAAVTSTSSAPLAVAAPLATSRPAASAATATTRAPIPTAEAKRESISASDLYLTALRMVCVDGKISPDEDERLSTLRRNYAISDQEHKDVLARLAMSEADFERLRKEGRAAERSKRECVICLDVESDHMVEDCGHVCLCATCALRFPPGDKCPKCRTIITRVKRVFL